MAEKRASTRGARKPVRSNDRKRDGYMPATGLGTRDEPQVDKRAKDAGEEGGTMSIGEYRPAIQEFLTSTTFDILIGSVICANALFLGIEISLTLEGHTSVALIIIESLFLVIYTIELGLRFVAYGVWTALQSTWVQFDTLLLVLGVVTAWILEPLSLGKSAGLGPVMVLRSLRLLRLTRTVRIVRLLAKYREFWLLIRGLMKSLSLMACNMVMLTLTLYVFACLGVELITNHQLNQESEEFAAHVEKYFRNLPMVMLTLLRFAVLDNTAEVYTKLVEHDPWLFLYFVVIICSLSLVFFQVAATVIHQCTLEQGWAESDRLRAAQEDEWGGFFRALKQMFLRMDFDGSGNISTHELKKMHPSDMKKLVQALNCDDAPTLFRRLDADKNGVVSISEFFDGLLSTVITQACHRDVIHLKRSEKQIEILSWKMKEVLETLHDLDCRLSHFAVREAESDRSSLRSGSKDGSGVGGGVDSKALSNGLSRPDADRDWTLELTDRLQKIWSEAVQHTVELTMRQIEEVQADTRQGISKAGRSMVVATPPSEAKKRGKKKAKTDDISSDVSDGLSATSEVSKATNGTSASSRHAVV